MMPLVQFCIIIYHRAIGERTSSVVTICDVLGYPSPRAARDWRQAHSKEFESSSGWGLASTWHWMSQISSLLEIGLVICSKVPVVIQSLIGWFILRCYIIYKWEEPSLYAPEEIPEQLKIQNLPVGLVLAIRYCVSIGYPQYSHFYFAI
jgi:hypothetical protein